MTLRHVVTWTLAATDEHTRREHAAQIVQRLHALVGVVPSIRALSAGADVVGEGNADVAIVADFDDRAGLDAYQVHPAHLEVVAYVRSVVDARSACDFDI